MTIYTDASGNFYAGSPTFGNYDLDYPTTNFMKAEPGTNWVSEMTALLNSINAKDILVQNGADDSITVVRFTFDFDVTGSNRNASLLGTGNTNVPTFLSIATKINFGNSLPPHSGGLAAGDLLQPNTIYSQWCAVANETSLGYATYNTGTNRVKTRMGFRYWGLLTDVNPNFDYFTQDPFRHYIMISGRENEIGIGHYTVNQKLCLTTGNAQYPITCSDGQTPGTKWAAPLHVFENNSAIGDPRIGRVQNFLAATGTGFTWGVPERIMGSVVPDAGSRWYLPVGQFAGKTLLMKVHSTEG
jgi:hypothetical protein